MQPNMKQSFLCRKRKRSSETNDNADQKIDRISDLPEDIIHHIMSFLPTQVEATTSVLSKKFHRAWLSYPNLNFDQHSFKIKTTLPQGGSYSAFRRKKTEEKRKKFIEYVEKSIRRICDQKLRIQKFKLKLTTSRYFVHQSPWINKWIKLAAENHVKELVLDFTPTYKKLYKLPEEIFACQSITVLELHYCNLSKGSLRLHSLQKLRLAVVYVNGCNPEDLFASCPSIEHLSISKCNGLKTLRFQGLLKLKTLALESLFFGKDRTLVDIEAPSLECLELSGVASTIVVSDCRELKSLTLRNETVTDRLFDYFISKFPTLETLEIFNCYKQQEIKFSSKHLKNFRIQNYNHMMSMEIDTRRLCSINYHWSGLPCPSANSSSYQWKAHLKYFDGRIIPLVNTSWYLSLKEFLGQANNIEVLTISFSKKTTVASTFAPEEISQVSFPTFSEPEHLSIGIETSKPSYAAFIDGLFWSCHPKTLSVASGTMSANDFIKFLCKNLINNKDPKCCCNTSTSLIKCWRHYLEDSKVASVEMVDKCNPHNWITHASTNSWKIPPVLLEERPLRWSTLLRSLPKLGGAHIHIALKWRTRVV